MDGRTRHYGDFYGLVDNPGRCAENDRPLLLVWGNCQAEALRILLDSDPAMPLRTVRIPPVHELESSDLPHVDRLVRQASVLLTQPIRAGYRSLPLGVPDLAEALAPDATVVRWPVLRYAGLHPFQVIVRHRSDPAAVPNMVPYHDLRTILAAHRGLGSDADWDVQVSEDGLRQAAEASLDELRRRERRDIDIVASDLFRDAGSNATHTINHASNVVLSALAQRILDHLNTGSTVRDPGRELLGGVRAPVEGRVLNALGLHGDPRPNWSVDGAPLSPDSVHRAHLQWYADRPEFVGAALERHAELIRTLELAP
ncbi:WcbI family polysaccharide biosynthesis putative acetyltransferase [Rhodococcus sp. IEGM 1330]|uniref:WcbI family polysaccharide biosynthesis putative acetyltransferase n=1 Tax=Rhodococcus sp. IEGM 1330 TaxID=3082225 RepID=UPI0029547570|nr:WcbI family polysaccharide biosynthesis putative acetyltransferase [Rhodococcus sp. IEGM 1330]MDV8020214.1 WcbI family polysaccharide biosynthesis putative acetyltransferase [Rhodococcus sp. IEGM 1330]